MLDDKEIHALARDVLSREMEAAIHQISRAALIRHFGGVVTPKIWFDGLSGIDRGTWKGQCRVYVIPGALDINHDAAGCVRPPANWRALVDLAGALGESLASGNCNLKPFNAMHSDADIGIVLDVLMAKWDEIQAETKRLLNT